MALELMLLGYLIGSIPFSFLVGRARGIDLRTVGSGSLGGSNVWRALGFRYFIVAGVLDLLKGWLPVYFAQHVLHTSALVVVGIALSAVLGHAYSIFMRFRGGKAIATTCGAILAFAPALAFGGVLVWTIIYRLSGYPSVASLTTTVVAASAGTLVSYAGYLHPAFAAFIWLATLLVFYFHRANIRRLRQGQEIGIRPRQ
ncbi:MAG TPA: glycerol-3-phosphate 1-O-acyltransferase PlsY [Herpetosiphonaceae bacterium]